MAIVYLARDLKHDRPVALKVLRGEYAVGLGVDRFLREIDIAAKLTHPHILPLYDSGEAEGFLYYVMPYVEDESLRDRLARETELPIEDAIRIAGQVADALGYAHRHGIIHRDIKPENILLEDGEAVVSDFGIARAVTAAAVEGLTADGIVVGTPQYMSPEQGSGAHDLDGRVDLYALGCVLHEMLTGEPPFTGRTAQAVIARHVSERPPSLRVVRPKTPPWLERVVHKALAKSPADRFPTAQSFSQALTAQAEPRFRLARLVPRGRRRQVVFALALAVSLTAVYIAGRALELRVERGRAPPIGAAATFDPARVAVLYFEDHSEAQRLGPLSAAFTKKLIHELSQVEALSVISFNGVRPYRDTNVTLDSIAHALKVGSVVEASIAESGEYLRVTVELVDPATARTLDSKELERPRGELFALQDDVFREVSRFLRERLGIEIRLRQRMAETGSVEAYTLFYRAEEVREDHRPLMKSADTQGAKSVLQRADRLLAQAESLDPRWVEPIVLRGWVAADMAIVFEVAPRTYSLDWLKTGLVHAERALELEPRDPAALELRGFLRFYLWEAGGPDQDAALRETAKQDLLAAVELDPSKALAWATLSDVYRVSGQFAEARGAARVALEADAFLTDAKDVVFRVCESALQMEDFDEAIPCFEEGRRRFPDNPAYVYPELVLLASGDGPEPDVEKAWQLLEKLEELMDPQKFAGYRSALLMTLAGVLARAGLADSAYAVMRGASRYSEPGDSWPLYYEANVRLQLGEPHLALGLLTLWLEANPDGKAQLATDYWWRPLRDDPRFQAIIEE